ncbi:MAG: prepilin-type N-terminal cleavage/methylation domain-containing protein [Phycisphaerales bacterium]|nr:prepilin-type N-terminal cleavage/methylation domain-containing protein [Phycisphaerales bacterium]
MNSRIGKRGFSLVELVVVIVIIGIIAAMAIPRLSRGAAGANQSSLGGNLSILRNAINLYAAEHNNTFPSGTGAQVADKLTKYTDAAGDAGVKTATRIYGPYVLKIPTCPVISGANSATILIDSTNSPPQVNTTNGEGWVYNPNTGEIIANSSATDADGKAYNTY